MVKLSPIDMGDILDPLEKQFKKMTAGQKEVWYDKLCILTRQYLEQAVDHLTEKNRTFPTIQEIKSAYYEARANDPHYREKSTEVKGCEHCRYGWVTFTRFGDTEHTKNRVYEFSHPCAYCHKQHNIPMVIKRDNQVYWACRKAGDRYYQDLNNLEFVAGSQPGRRLERNKDEFENLPF